MAAGVVGVLLQTYLIPLSLWILGDIHSLTGVESKSIPATAAPEHPTFYYERFTNWMAVGSGAFGTVYRARDTARNGEFVAIKALRKHQNWWGDWSYEKELRILRLVAETNFTRVVRLLGNFEQGDMAYFVMEYCRYGTLLDRIATGSPLREELAASVLYQLVLAVRLLHELNYAHNDVYPRNVLVAELDARSGNMMVKLADFGISETLVRPGESVQPGWSKHRRDMHDLSYTLYFAMTGAWPNFSYDKDYYPLFPVCADEDSVHIHKRSIKPTAPFHRLSLNARQLLKKMLRWTLDDADMMTFDEILQHPFVKSGEKWALKWPLYDGDSS